MANIIEITDLSAPELDAYARLTEAQLKNRRHPEDGLFIAESLTVIRQALVAGCVPVSFLMERRHLEGDAKELLSALPDIPVYTGDRAMLSQLTGYALTRGVLCALRRPRLRQPEEFCPSTHRLAVLESIVDPTNLGAIFRSAAALGMDGVLLSPTCCDPLSRRALRVSMGTVFQIPWAYLGQDHRCWPGEAMAQLNRWGFQTAAMALDHRAISVDRPELKTIDRLAIFLGTEGTGLRPDTIAVCDYTVMIPMSHGVDSLNVAAASAVAFWTLKKPG